MLRAKTCVMNVNIIEICTGKSNAATFTTKKSETGLKGIVSPNKSMQE